MAQNVVVNFIGQNKLSKTTAAMSADLRKFQGTAKSVGNTLNKVLGAAGIGLGFAQLANVLKTSTKAAVEDNKSQALLANALKNTVGATAGAIRSAESYIAKTQLSAAVLDDNLRPALATAVRATGSLSKGQSLLNTALDVSAGTGKDLGTVTNAIAKAYNGNTGALKKLLPSIKTGGDFMAQLNQEFKGAAETAANADPYQRFQIVLADIQETIGQALLPALAEFSTYLASSEGQKNVKKIVDLFVGAGKAVSALTTFVIKNIKVIGALAAALITVKTGWFLITTAVKAYEFAVRIAAITTKTLRTALVTTGVGALVVALGFLAEAFITAGESSETARKKITADDLNGRTFWQYQADMAQEAWSKSYEAKAKAEKARVPKIWELLGFSSLAEYKADLKAQADKLKLMQEEIAKKVKGVAEKFRDSIGLAFGTFGKDESTVFNVDVVINKLKRVIDAAKGFKDNLARLTKAGAGQDVIQELIGMGPAQGNIVAKGLLQSGRLSEYLGLRGSLFKTGIQAGTVAQGTAEKSYTVNINKANVSAEEIVRAIRTLEKKSGRKYFAN